jgi:hypothetical protein
MKSSMHGTMAKMAFSKVTMKRFISLLLLTAAASVQAQSYLSPTPPPHGIEDRFRLEVSLLHASYDTQIRIDPSLQTPGTVVSAEDDLKLDSSSNNIQMELTLLPGKHHMIRLQGLSMRRSGSTVLTKTVIWDDNVYVAGDKVDSHLDLSMVGLTYGWLPFRTDRYEFGVTIGIQIAEVNANCEVRSRAVRPDNSAVAPLPLVGLEGRYDFSRHWSIEGRYQYLKVNANDVQGSLPDARVALRWRQNQHLLYGLGYRSFTLDINSADPDTPGMVHLNMTGPMVYVQGSL